jgi:hypothetical protein
MSILRRFDMDGDGKVNFKEFQVGMKPSLTVFKKSMSVKKLARPKSGAREPPRKSLLSASKSESKFRPLSSYTPAGGQSTRRRDTELRQAHSKKKIGPNSNYFI